MVTELTPYNLGVALSKTLIFWSYLINFLITGGLLCSHHLLFSVKFDLLAFVKLSMPLLTHQNNSQQFSEQFTDRKKFHDSTTFLSLLECF